MHIFIVTVLLILGAWTSSHAETRVSGIIDTEVKWTPKAGPYIVEGDILVTREASLFIMPGTRILIGRPTSRETKIGQRDRPDSGLVAIKIEGMLRCVGTPDNRIVFSSQGENANRSGWYGIVFDGASDAMTEIAYTDIADACTGVTVRGCTPLVRTTLIEHNTVGFECIDKGNARVFNCLIARNAACGLRIQASNPEVHNNIIVYNRNNGVWGDRISKIDFKYNCVFDNPDGDYLDCDPELGVLRKVNKNKDSTDAFDNLRCDPIFAGSSQDSAAVEYDKSLPTDKSRVADTALAKALHGELSDSLGSLRRRDAHSRNALSSYSPCINAGNPDKRFQDIDESRNDMGMWGGPETLGEAGEVVKAEEGKPVKKVEKKHGEKKTEKKHGEKKPEKKKEHE